VAGTVGGGGASDDDEHEEDQAEGDRRGGDGRGEVVAMIDGDSHVTSLPCRWTVDVPSVRRTGLTAVCRVVSPNDADAPPTCSRFVGS
jgi:hypothetical protein